MFICSDDVLVLVGIDGVIGRLACRGANARIFCQETSSNSQTDNILHLLDTIVAYFTGMESPEALDRGNELMATPAVMLLYVVVIRDVAVELVCGGAFWDLEWMMPALARQTNKASGAPGPS